MLITPEYLELQKRLHAEYDYGKGVDAVECERLIREMAPKGASVLDYGCGQGHLGVRLRPDYDVREYDPCIPGRDAPPEPAEYVVCADVLEHIEPELLDNVLNHIRSITRGQAIFIIATGPSNKIMEDGRSAHLIVEGADWWRQKLDALYDVKEFYDRSGVGKGLLVVAKPYLELGEIKGKGAVADDMRNEQVRINCAKVKKRLKVRSPIEPHKRVAVLLCYGPSLQDTWSTALLERQNIPNADFVTVSGSHDFVISRGIIPRFHVECDPRKHKADMISKSHRNVEYLMASCTHPDVIDRLLDRKRKVRLWHLHNGESSVKCAVECDHEAVMVGGGGSVGLRAIPLMMAMGYRRFIIHGMDCSYRGEMQHAGWHSGKVTDQIEVRCGGVKFLTSAVLVSYLRNFDDLREYIGDPEKDPFKIEIILRGDGLLQHALKVGGGAIAGPMPMNGETNDSGNSQEVRDQVAA